MVVQTLVNIVIWHFDFQTIIIITGHGSVLYVCPLCNVANLIITVYRCLQNVANTRFLFARKVLK